LVRIQLLVGRKPCGARRVIVTLLQWSLLVNVGIAGILGFYSRTFNAAATAEFIAWAPGSPFQFEVATANLAFGVLGVLCLWFGGAFWAATASASRCSSRVQPTAAFATSSYTTTTRPVTPG